MAKLKYVLLLLIACGAFLVMGALTDNSDNILQSSVWNVNNGQDKWEFSNGTIYVEATNKTYNYKLDQESNLSIKDGDYAGQYVLKNDASNYRLLPTNKQGHEIKLTRVSR